MFRTLSRVARVARVARVQPNHINSRNIAQRVRYFTTNTNTNNNKDSNFFSFSKQNEDYKVTFTIKDPNMTAEEAKRINQILSQTHLQVQDKDDYFENDGSIRYKAWQMLATIVATHNVLCI